jgi:hypothetical protein
MRELSMAEPHKYFLSWLKNQDGPLRCQDLCRFELARPLLIGSCYSSLDGCGIEACPLLDLNIVIYIGTSGRDEVLACVELFDLKYARLQNTKQSRISESEKGGSLSKPGRIERTEDGTHTSAQDRGLQYWQRRHESPRTYVGRAKSVFYGDDGSGDRA